MLPTSIAVRRTTGEPHIGQGSPSRAFAMSVTRSGVKSRPTLTLRRWKPARFAPATRFDERAARSSTTTNVSVSADRRRVSGLHAGGADLLLARRPRSPPLTALASLVSLTSSSPRTMAETRRPSSATKKIGLGSLGCVGCPRNAASVGDRRACPASRPLPSAEAPRRRGSGRAHVRDLLVRRVAALVAEDERVLAGRVRTMNSCASVPPIIPMSDATDDRSSPSARRSGSRPRSAPGS